MANSQIRVKARRGRLFFASVSGHRVERVALGRRCPEVWRGFAALPSLVDDAHRGVVQLRRDRQSVSRFREVRVAHRDDAPKLVGVLNSREP